MRQKPFKAATAAVAMAAMFYMPAAPLQAEDNVVTLREIITIVKENNKELQALRAEKGIGDAGRIRAGLYPNPVLELDGATGAMTGSSGENRVTVGVTQEFLTGGKRGKRLASADSELLRFDSRLKDVERQLISDVKTGYYDLLLAEGRRDLANTSRELNSQLLLIARERFAAGEIAELDVNLAKLETARSAGKTIDVERELISQRQRLFSLMGVAPQESLKFAARPETASCATDLATLKLEALQKRPDLQMAEAEQQKSEAELSLAEAEKLPNVTAGIGVSWERSATSLGGLEERNNDYLIGLKLTVPIPVFDRNQAGIKEALARKSGAEIRRQFVRQTVERDVEAVHGRLASAENALNIYGKEIMPQLTENLKLIQEAYRLGEVGILAVIEEQKKFIEVSEGNLSAQNDRNRALAQLEAAVGIELNNLNGGTQ